jgi:putative ABC transport system permease protein
MDAVSRDVSVAFKSLRRNPALYSVAALSLALGIAANTTIFTAADALLYRPLPYPEAERIAQVWTTNTERGWTAMSSSLPDIADWAAASPAELAAYQHTSANLVGGDQPERIAALRVTPSFFRVLGVQPALGRSPTAEEATAGGAAVVVISHSLWQRRFGGDAGVLGRVLSLDGTPHEVIGVMPAGFQFAGTATDMWLPLRRTGEESRDARSYGAIARLHAGASFASLEASLQQVAAQLEAAYPAENRSIGARA